MLLQTLDGLVDVTHVPELDFTVVSTAGQVILLVGVEVQVTHQLPVSILNAVDLTVYDKNITSHPQTNVSDGEKRSRTTDREGKREIRMERFS